MDNIDKIKIIDEKIRLLDRSIFVMQRNIEIDGERKPGKTFEDHLKDMFAKKQSLLNIKQQILLSDII